AARGGRPLETGGLAGWAGARRRGRGGPRRVRGRGPGRGQPPVAVAHRGPPGAAARRARVVAPPPGPAAAGSRLPALPPADGLRRGGGGPTGGLGPRDLAALVPGAAAPAGGRLTGPGASPRAGRAAERPAETGRPLVPFPA